MKRAFGGGRMKWAHAIAKRWAMGVLCVAMLAVLGVLFVGQQAHAAPASVAKWLNRQYLVDDRGVNYLDVNTFDKDFSYVEQTGEKCPDIIKFVPSIDGAPTSDDQFFYRLASYGNYNSTLIVSTPGKDSANRDICNDTSGSIVVNDPKFRRITWYKDDNNKIINMFSGITFSQNASRPDFKGTPRYFRDSEVADVNNSCPDMILLHAAEPISPSFWSGDTAEFLFGPGEIPESAMLFSVEKNDSLGRTSESYKIDSELPINEDTCHIRASAVDRKLTGEYPLYLHGAASYDVMFMAAGLDANGNPAHTDRRYADDSFIIFIGNMNNLPRDSAGQPIDDPANPGGSNPDQISERVCRGGGLGWVICPIVTGIEAGASLIRDAMAYFLAVNPLPIGSGPIYEAWNNIRNIANILFVIGFFIIIFSQATSIGISNYGIKRLLPRLIIVAIATNISYFICSFMIDIFNIMGVGVTNLIGIVNGGSAGTINIDGGTGAIFVGGLTAAIGIAFTTGAILQIFPILVAAFLAVLVMFLILAMRQALIILLVIIAPIAFVAALLPGTQQWFNRWMGMFVGMLVMYPLIMGLFAAIRLASAILSTLGN